HRAGAVREHLDLDVARVDDGLLEVERGISEGRLRLALSRLQGLPQPVGGVDATHTSSASSGDRLDERGEADLLRGGLEGVQVLAGGGAAQRRYAGLPRGGDRLRLVPGEVEHLGPRAHEGDAVALALLGE